jgi:hypothetical protein
VSILTDKLDTLHKLTRGIEDDRHPTTDDLLQVLRMVEETSASALRDVVFVARKEGMSWDQIGKRLGVSRQAAWERYGA